MLPATATVLAVDFGTTNTVATVRTPTAAPRPLLFDGSPLLPSAVYRHPDGRLLVGRDAQRAAHLEPAAVEPHPKRRVDDGTLWLGGTPVPVVAAVAAVLGHVAEQARRQAGGCDDLRLTHPAAWGPRRRAVLLDAARTAGLPAPRLLAEPVAAAGHYTAVLGAALPAGRALAVYDLGGGTFDAAVVRRTATGFTVLAERGLDDVGGLDFDHALVEHLGRGHASGRTGLWRGLLAADDTGRRRQRALLYDDVRAAKEALSRGPSADVRLPALDLAAHLTRPELEELIRPALARTVDCLREAVAAAGLAPGDLAGVFLVGGSSRIPLAARLLHAGLGTAPTTLEQPETAVALGALHVEPSDAPVPGPAGARSAPPAAPGPPRIAAGSAAVRQPPWYADATVRWTIVLFVLVVIAFGVFVAVLAS